MKERPMWTDAEWALLAPLLSGYAPLTADLREMVNACLDLEKTGCAWRDLPTDFGPRPTVRTWPDRFRADGLWAEMAAVLNRAQRQQKMPSISPTATASSKNIYVMHSQTGSEPDAAHLFFQLVSRRYERGSMLITSNRAVGEWGSVFGDPVVATALLDRLLHHAVVVQIEGSGYRLRQHADLIPEHVRSKGIIAPPVQLPPPRRRERPPKNGYATPMA